MEVGTPVTNKYYLAASSGEMYGLDHGKNRFSPETFAALRSDTGIPGLFLTGLYPYCFISHKLYLYRMKTSINRKQKDQNKNVHSLQVFFVVIWSNLKILSRCHGCMCCDMGVKVKS